MPEKEEWQRIIGCVWAIYIAVCQDPVIMCYRDRTEKLRNELLEKFGDEAFEKAKQFIIETDNANPQLRLPLVVGFNDETKSKENRQKRA